LSAFWHLVQAIPLRTRDASFFGGLKATLPRGSSQTTSATMKALRRTGFRGWSQRTFGRVGSFIFLAGPFAGRGGDPCPRPPVARPNPALPLLHNKSRGRRGLQVRGFSLNQSEGILRFLSLSSVGGWGRAPAQEGWLLRRMPTQWPRASRGTIHLLAHRHPQGATNGTTTTTINTIRRSLGGSKLGPSCSSLGVHWALKFQSRTFRLFQGVGMRLIKLSTGHTCGHLVVVRHVEKVFHGIAL